MIIISYSVKNTSRKIYKIIREEIKKAKKQKVAYSARLKISLFQETTEVNTPPPSPQILFSVSLMAVSILMLNTLCCAYTYVHINTYAVHKYNVLPCSTFVLAVIYVHFALNS